MARKQQNEQKQEATVENKKLTIKERIDNLRKSREQLLHGLSKVDGALEILQSLEDDGIIKNG